MHCVASISAQNNKVYPQIGLKHTLSNLDFRAQPRPYDKKKIYSYPSLVVSFKKEPMFDWVGALPFRL